MITDRAAARDDPHPSTVTMMNELPRDSIRELSRRDCLCAVAAWLIQAKSTNSSGDDALVALVNEHAKKVGLGPFKVGKTARYLGIGDAPDAFRSRALELCETLARDFLRHFKEKRFEVAPPESRMGIVILANPTDFAAFREQEIDPASTGVYDLDSNLLVICDNRVGGGAVAARTNTVTLFHEATHQLTFNTGMLDRKAEYPLALSEGLATYVEVRSADGKRKIGDPYAERLAVLRSDSQPWIPIAKLIADDELFRNEESQQRAYAQSWVFAHALLKSADRLPAFRAYTKDKLAGTKNSDRVAVFAKHLGDPAKLDAELQRHAKTQMRRL